ncbi:hypothetical protein Tco_1572909 [Tanacetum coccineum]
MKREGKDFSGRVTPLFDSILVQASEEVGEDSIPRTDSTQIPIINQPSTFSQPKKKQKSSRKQRKEAEVLDLEKAKSDQAIKIASLKKRVDKLKKRRQLRTTGLKIFKKLGTARRVKSYNASLGAQEDASKHRRNDDEVFADVTTSEKDEHSTKLDDSTVGEAVITASVAPTTIKEITLAKTLIQIKAAKPKVVTTVATTTTTTRPKAKGVVVQEPSKFRVLQEAQPSISKDKGKAMMEADRLMAERFKSKEREELTDEEKRKLFIELMEKRRKHFAALRA